MRETIITMRPLDPDTDKIRRGLDMYDAIFKGEVIVHATRTPALDACRNLVARGITGTLIVLGPDGGHRMTVDIVRGAALTVRDLRFVEFDPDEPELAT